MTNLLQLIERLPECEAKASLRGLAVAAPFADDDDRQQILVRMAAIVRRWRERDPLASLDAELARQQEQPELCLR